MPHDLTAAHTLASTTLDCLHLLSPPGLCPSVPSAGCPPLTHHCFCISQRQVPILQGSKFHLLHNTLLAPLLLPPSSLLLGALHSTLKCLGLVPSSICPETINCMGRGSQADPALS